VPERTSPDLRIATAAGTGSGRFLAVSILDALDAGGRLASVRFFPPVRPNGPSSVDIVFEHSGAAHREVIRAGLDAAERVVSAEILHSFGDRDDRRYPGAAALQRALRAGAMVDFVKVDSGSDPGAPRALTLELRQGERFHLDLTSFVQIAKNA